MTESRVSQMRSEGLALMRTGIAAQYSDTPVVEEPESGRAASRRAAYAAALSSRSTYADRLTRQKRPIAAQLAEMGSPSSDESLDAATNSVEEFAAAV